ncbi:hypothetical protein MKK64_19015 [Methylobacterium sp. E-025]|uniref:hypothetical protein n=1 Tax=Methylobacterium sp. E-025 TaxID=2836561 RepID=UPI001FBAE4C9|nr:hypothetical protein [Methylobacterium sp. E-025]MCJ2113273.1 hypothetical protein [Methylobacterium sp. E-025]
MPKYRADFFDEVEDTTAARSEVFDAADESAAAHEAKKRMQPHEKRVDVTPVDGGQSFTLDDSKLSGGATLG